MHIRATHLLRATPLSATLYMSLAAYVSPTGNALVLTHVRDPWGGAKTNCLTSNTPLGPTVRLFTKIRLPTLFTNSILLLLQVLSPTLPSHQSKQEELSNHFMSSKLFGLVRTSAGLISPRALPKTALPLCTHSCNHRILISKCRSLP